MTEDAERDVVPETKQEKDMSGTEDERDRRHELQSEDEDDDSSRRDSDVNPLLFSSGHMQAFQNVMAQLTVNAANNMDRETMNNVAMLQTALFTLHQQHILQAQVIHHLQSELLKKNGEKTEDDDQDSESKDEETELRSSSPIKRLEETTVELDLR